MAFINFDDPFFQQQMRDTTYFSPGGIPQSPGVLPSVPGPFNPNMSPIGFNPTRGIPVSNQSPFIGNVGSPFNPNLGDVTRPPINTGGQVVSGDGIFRDIRVGDSGGVNIGNVQTPVGGGVRLDPGDPIPTDPLPIPPDKIAGDKTAKKVVNETTNTNAATKKDLSPYKEVRQSNSTTRTMKDTVQVDLQDPKYIPSNSRIYTRFDQNHDVIENIKRIHTKGIWGSNSCLNTVGGTGSMYTHFTSSIQSEASKQYYYDVKIGQDVCGVEYSIAYGNYVGSGSLSAGGQVDDTPSRAIYSQYKLFTDIGETQFKINSVDVNDIYVININKSRLGDKLDPGNWELNLAELNGGAHANNFYTGSNVAISASNKIISLIDDSNDTDQRFASSLSDKRYNVISGSISNGAYSTSSFGYVYPNLGVIILDASKLNSEVSFNTVTGSNINGDNAMKLFKSISGSSQPFIARNSKLVTETTYFIRVKNNEYNFSNNITFRSGSLGEFRQPTFEGDPKTYITTVGLYNDYNELVAIAKMSQPIKKSYTDEKLFEVKVEY